MVTMDSRPSNHSSYYDRLAIPDEVVHDDLHCRLYQSSPSMDEHADVTLLMLMLHYSTMNEQSSYIYNKQSSKETRGLKKINRYSLRLCLQQQSGLDQQPEDIGE
jgi:hypothetical protein